MFYYFILALICAIVSFVIIFDFDDYANAPEAGFLAAIVFVVVWLVCWLLLPNMGWRFTSWIGILLTVSAISFIIAGSLGVKTGANLVVTAAIVVFAVVFLFISWFSTAEAFHYKDYRDLLTVSETTDSNYHADFVPIKPDEMIKVDVPLAGKYASAVLEQDAAIGSSCCVNRFYRIRLQEDLNVTLATGETKILPLKGEVVYLSPLEHSSFWRWKRNRTTPGYILVSAQRQNEVYFITKVNGEYLRLKYLRSSFFDSYIKRHIRKAGYLNGVTNFSVVLDPSGRPFVTATLYCRTIGFSGEKVTGMLTVDVQTGEIKEYTLDNLPSWIDRVYPENFVRRYINYWGKYPQYSAKELEELKMKGETPKKLNWRNSFLSRTKVKMMTPGMTALYNNGERYIYTGIQSAGADDGTSGIMMFNSTTGEATLYKLEGGANEESTRAKFEKNYKIDAAEVSASEVIIYPVRGENLYFATLKGASGDFLGYGISSVKYRELAAVGKSVDEALLNYYVAKRNANLDTQAIESNTTESEVYKVSLMTMEDGIYYFRFEGISGKEYMALPKLSKELKWTQIGDRVQVSYSQSMAEDESIMLENFENLSFAF